MPGGEVAGILLWLQRRGQAPQGAARMAGQRAARARGLRGDPAPAVDPSTCSTARRSSLRNAAI